MTKRNGTAEEAVLDAPTKDAGALPLIEQRIKALEEQRQRIAQQQQRLAMEDLGCQGALATLGALRDEILAETEKGS